MGTAVRVLAIVVAIPIVLAIYAFLGWNLLTWIGPQLGGIPSLPAING